MNTHLSLCLLPPSSGKGDKYSSLADLFALYYNCSTTCCLRCMSLSLSQGISIIVGIIIIATPRTDKPLDVDSDCTHFALSYDLLKSKPWHSSVINTLYQT